MFSNFVDIVVAPVSIQMTLTGEMTGKIKR